MSSATASFSESPCKVQLWSLRHPLTCKVIVHEQLKLFLGIISNRTCFYFFHLLKIERNVLFIRKTLKDWMWQTCIIFIKHFNNALYMIIISSKHLLVTNAVHLSELRLNALTPSRPFKEKLFLNFYLKT